MSEACQDALRVSFDHAIKLEFHGARVSSDAGLFPFRDLDDAVQRTESSAAQLFDFRTGSNIRQPEHRFCVPPPLVAARRGSLRLNSRWDGHIFVC